MPLRTCRISLRDADGITHSVEVQGEATPDSQRLGCELLLVGVSLERNGPFQFTHCVRMKSPEFWPELVPGVHWLSIGCGQSETVGAL